jgi:hypothetical protein
METAELDYREFIASTASRVPSFRRLNAFLQSGCLNSNDIQKPSGETKISYITFEQKNPPSEPVEVTEKDLAQSLKEAGDAKLYIIENISPTGIAVLGGNWNIDPQFFLDYLDDAPWSRYIDVEKHLAALPSVKKTQTDHIAFKFVASREFYAPFAQEMSHKLPDRLESEHLASGMTKVGGGLNPIPRDGREFQPVAMIRRAAAIWVDPEYSSTRTWRKCASSPCFVSFQFIIRANQD